MKRSVLILFYSLLISAIPQYLLSSEQQIESPVKVIEEFNDILLESMKKGAEIGYKGRYALLEPVMIKSFFFEYMTRKSTGSYWKEMNKDQKEETFEKYVVWSIGTFAKRFKEYNDQRFEIVSQKRFRNKYWQVISQIVNAGGGIRRFEYILLVDQERWRIIDIQIEGVSQLSLTRSQFKTVLRDKGVNGLLDELDEKISNLNADDN